MGFRSQKWVAPESALGTQFGVSICSVVEWARGVCAFILSCVFQHDIFFFQIVRCFACQKTGIHQRSIASLPRWHFPDASTLHFCPKKKSWERSKSQKLSLLVKTALKTAAEIAKESCVFLEFLHAFGAISFCVRGGDAGGILGISGLMSGAYGVQPLSVSQQE